MKVFRFMSNEEFEKYNKGEVLKNRKKHKNKTNSIGFCFFKLDDYKPEEAMHFVSGVVNFEICAIFEVEEKFLNKTYGVYAKPIKNKEVTAEDLINLFLGFNQRFIADEYCTKKYSNKNFKLLKYSENIWSQWDFDNTELKYEIVGDEK